MSPSVAGDRGPKPGSAFFSWGFGLSADRVGMSHFLDCVREGVFCALCYSGLKGRRPYRGHYGWRQGCNDRPHGVKPVAIQRRDNAGPPDCSGAVAGDGDSPFGDYPDLVDFLCMSKWPDGAPRETGTAMIFCEDLKWKVWLHDRDGKASCFVSANSLGGALGAAEGAVSGQTGDWRPDRKKGSRGG